ncbi:hypothetical protein Plec18167_002199 [Paecilomyces lecythidis]|uniref:FAD-binding domain-containing protein n=1 Tax=Paecilomyces lecythidis TaxID=3004212 RepID=A0ABR3Y981_9EURO
MEASSHSKDKVIVIGAGPVGLMTALRLAQVGIRADVIEKEEDLSQQPRAVGYHGGALIALKRTAVYEKAKKAGFTGKGICWRKPLIDDGPNGKKLGDIIAHLPFAGNEDTIDEQGNPVLYLPQPKLTRLFYEACIETGLVNVFFKRELCDLHNDLDSVTAIARNAEGGLESYRGAFLVGADGGKSATRKLLKIPFKGHSWPERIVAIDLLMEDKNIDPAFYTSMIIHPINFGLVTPLEPIKDGQKTLYRCSIAVDPKDPRTDEELVSDAHVKYILDKFAPGPRPLDVQILNASPYRTHQVCASTMRRGRCLLAGDAAHMNNPFGALGLTSGLLDADALADTLDLIINEGKPMDLLDVYSDARRKAFQTFVDPVSTQNKLRCANDPETATEDWFLRSMINPNPEESEEFNKMFFDVWRTDMRKLISKTA